MSKKHNSKHHPEPRHNQVAGSGTDDPLHHSLEGQNGPECKYEPPEKEKRIWGMTVFERIMSLLTVLAVLVASVTGFVIYWQVQEMRTDQRAWVGFGEIKGVTLEPGKPFTIVVPLQNVGKTPAKSVASGFNVGLFKKTEKPDFDSLVSPFMAPAPVALMLPGQIQEMHGDMFDAASGSLPLEVWTQIHSADFSLFAYGKITYTDIFGRNHWTRYCVASEPHPIQGIKFRQCLFYNGIDEEKE